MTVSSNDPGKDAHDMGQLPNPGLFDGFALVMGFFRRVARDDYVLVVGDQRVLGAVADVGLVGQVRGAIQATA